MIGERAHVPEGRVPEGAAIRLATAEIAAQAEAQEALTRLEAAMAEAPKIKLPKIDLVVAARALQYAPALLRLGVQFLAVTDAGTKEALHALGVPEEQIIVSELPMTTEEWVRQAIAHYLGDRTSPPRILMTPESVSQFLAGDLRLAETAPAVLAVFEEASQATRRYFDALA